MFRSFNQVGVTVLISTHDESLIERFSTRTLRLQHGELLA
jgi:cell division transport system ATP-binding protein